MKLLRVGKRRQGVPMKFSYPIDWAGRLMMMHSELANQLPLA